MQYVLLLGEYYNSDTVDNNARFDATVINNNEDVLLLGDRYNSDKQ